MEFKELTVLNDKIKWMNQFKKSYEGESRDLSLEVYKNNISRFFVAIENGQHLGFVRITNKSRICEGVWGVSDAYVKEQYRSSGVLRGLISYVIKNHNVAMLHIELGRYQENYDYYSSLGFNKYRTVTESNLVNLYHDSLVSKMKDKVFYSFDDIDSHLSEFDAAFTLPMKLSSSSFVTVSKY
jgi:hypothetical protein